MPILTPRDVHVNAPLTSISVAYLQSQDSYIATKVFPVVPVQKQADVYFKFNKGDLLRDEVKIRAPGTESAGASYSVDKSSTYYCPEYSLHHDIDDSRRANTDMPLDPDRNAAQFLTQKFLTKQEVLWASACFATSKWAKDWTGQASSPSTDEFLQWNVDGSDPSLVISQAKSYVHSQTGYTPNTVVIASDVWSVLENHPMILDRIKFTGGFVTEALIAQLFGVKRVLIAKAIKNASAEGVTDSLSYVMSDGVLVCYTPDAPGLEIPAAGYTFSWNGRNGGMSGYRGGNGAPFVAMKKYRMEHLNSDRVEGFMPLDMRIVCSDLGLFLTDVLS